MVASLSLSAQKVMRVEMNDGTVAKYATSSIKQISFEDFMTPGTAVDLGLPSGTLWSDRNVGASKAADTGNYYGWGETETHEAYSWEVYALWDYDNDQWIAWDGDSLDFANSSSDVAHVKWAGEWRTPSQAQFQELVDNCTWTYTTLNGTTGFEVKATNGNTIFLHSAGMKCDDYTSGQGESTYQLSAYKDFGKGIMAGSRW